MKKKVRFLVMFLLLIVTFTTAIPVKAKEETASTEDNLNLDVIYVIDGSGSMERADPKYMAPEAGKLFTELCASSAEVPELDLCTIHMFCFRAWDLPI